MNPVSMARQQQKTNESRSSDLDLIQQSVIATHEQLIRMQQLLQPDDPVDPFVLVDFYDNIPNSTTLILKVPSDRPILVKSVSVVIPATATGTLQIGKRMIPLQAVTIPPLQGQFMIVFPADTIQLTSSVSGNLYLEIMGNSLRGQNWRVIS